GCGKSSGSSPAPAGTEPVTLTVNLFGDFDYKPLYEQYKQTHPNITVKENITDYDTHHKNLKQHLTAGAGLADIEVIEIGQIAGFQGQASKFVNFLDQGVDPSTWTDQRVKDASSADGKVLFGLGTDTGGLAMCYRPSLMKKAGLPAFTPQWNTGFQKAGFATITCPAWMMSYIKANAPDTKGDWNVATIPGTGGGNWGGSYLTIPRSGKHVQQAIELAKWLAAPEQQTLLFK